jgi:hypothetical protein
VPWNYLYVEQRRSNGTVAALRPIVYTLLHTTTPRTLHTSGVVYADECDRRRQTTPRRWRSAGVVSVANGVAVRIHYTRYWCYTGERWMRNEVKPTPEQRHRRSVETDCIHIVAYNDAAYTTYERRYIRG